MSLPRMRTFLRLGHILAHDIVNKIWQSLAEGRLGRLGSWGGREREEEVDLRLQAVFSLFSLSVS